jgi:[acyl-carrier-protein] S-malonyltransferase
LSGTKKGVAFAADWMHSKQCASRSLPLPVSAPFHCSLMEPAAEMMKEALDHIDIKMPKIDVISNVTGEPVFVAFSSLTFNSLLLRTKLLLYWSNK